MAFARSKLLRVVTKYSQELNNPYSLDPKKMIYDPSKYGFQYSNKVVAEGYEKGARFLNRIPRFKELHPEIMDKIKVQRMILALAIIGGMIFVRKVNCEMNQQDVDMHYQLFKDKEFGERYAYKQLDVEYVPRLSNHS